ncbi:MAG TPA: TIGR04563 family protein [Polyangia bacterium]|jgi:uncharacterized small protein (TIGR04563 family)|nr:TIGR04563 family protein [Polyangia bacterium]
MPSAKRKVTLYFNSVMLAETQHEAIRQDRSISWIIQAAWRRARDEVRKLPSAARGEASPAAPDAPDATD